MLGRCRRRVLVCDAGNAAQRRVARAARLPDARRHRRRSSSCASAARSCSQYGIEPRAVDGHRHRLHQRRIRRDARRRRDASPTRTVLIATGVRDRLPDDSRHRRVLRHQRAPLPVLRRLGGARQGDSSVHRPGRVGGRPRALAEDVEPTTSSLCTNGRARLQPAPSRSSWREHGIAVHERPIERVEHERRPRAAARPRRRRRASPCDADLLLDRAAAAVRSAAAARVRAHAARASSRPTTSGRRACPGSTSSATPRATCSSSIVAAAEGAKAAVAINKALQARGRTRRRRSVLSHGMTDRATSCRHAAPPDATPTRAGRPRASAASRSR